ncbi:MAG: hypothetical protein WC890_04070 [Candidatus Margulisiibacteriota bacterium]
MAPITTIPAAGIPAREIFQFQSFQSSQEGVICDSTTTQSPAEIVGSIMQYSRPQILAFGEIHPAYDCADTPDNEQNTLVYLANQVIPVLSQYGIDDLAFELYQGRAVTKELNFFYSPQGYLNSKLTPWLSKAAALCSLTGFDQLLDQAKAYGIRLHPGSLTLQELKQPRHLINGWDRNRTGIIANNMLTVIQRLAKSDKPFAVYSGHILNDINPIYQDTSFGDDLAAQDGLNYKEIDLFDLTALVNYNQAVPADFYPPLREYIANTDPTHASCYNPTPNHYVLTLPPSSP